MGILAKMISAASAGNEPLYVEDVFSTYLYTGNSSTQTITNGIDLDGEGGMVWTKCRSTATNNALVDTVRGANKTLDSELTAAEGTYADITAFNSTGYSLSSVSGWFNTSSRTYASWTFRKAPKFFDIVTYTGDGTAGRSISHDLGSTPGMIIVKPVSATGSWYVYHRGFPTFSGQLEGTGNFNANAMGAVTDTTFTTGSFVANWNTNGVSYVAYLFAHDDSDEGVIQCGSLSHTGGSVTTVTLGWEPQYVMFKRADGTGGWFIYDTARGLTADFANDRYLAANTSSAESVNGAVGLLPRGFTFPGGQTTGTYIYIAIRRPMKVPESGTEVFTAVNTTSPTGHSVGFPPDFAITRAQNVTQDNYAGSRLQGSGVYHKTNTAGAEASLTNAFYWNQQNTAGNSIWAGGTQEINWYFRRAPGFMDIVCYTGNNTSGRNEPHNLKVTPELMIVKCRAGGTYDWMVWHKDLVAANSYIVLNTAAAETTSTGAFNGTAPTDTVFTLGNSFSTNSTTSYTYVAYLFATLPGISKVGSYTGTGTTLQIDCGFAAGARFVLIKRTDSTGDWYVWDTVRGIVSGNDPYLLLNSSGAEVTSTDYIDPYSAGFEISSSAPTAINASGGTFIYLAIA